MGLQPILSELQDLCSGLPFWAILGLCPVGSHLKKAASISQDNLKSTWSLGACTMWPCPLPSWGIEVPKGHPPWPVCLVPRVPGKRTGCFWIGSGWPTLDQLAPAPNRTEVNTALKALTRDPWKRKVPKDKDVHEPNWKQLHLDWPPVQYERRMSLFQSTWVLGIGLKLKQGQCSIAAQNAGQGKPVMLHCQYTDAAIYSNLIDRS